MVRAKKEAAAKAEEVAAEPAQDMVVDNEETKKPAARGRKPGKAVKAATDDSLPKRTLRSNASKTSLQDEPASVPVETATEKNHERNLPKQKRLLIRIKMVARRNLKWNLQ